MTSNNSIYMCDKIPYIQDSGLGGEGGWRRERGGEFLRRILYVRLLTMDFRNSSGTVAYITFFYLFQAWPCCQWRRSSVTLSCSIWWKTATFTSARNIWRWRPRMRLPYFDLWKTMLAKTKIAARDGLRIRNKKKEKSSRKFRIWRHFGLDVNNMWLIVAWTTENSIILFLCNCQLFNEKRRLPVETF